MLDFSAMYACTMHATLLMLTGNYTETLGTLELELAATSCHIYMALQLMFLIAKYVQLVGKELDSPEVILSLFFFNPFAPEPPVTARNRPCGSRSFLPFVTSSVLMVKDNFLR